MTVGVLATLQIDPPHVEPVRAALLRLAEHAAGEDGTELFTVHEAVGQDGRFVVFERYRDDAAVQAHRGSTAMDDFRRALRSAGVRPDLVFLTPLNTDS
jgi:quinol monooxygenase YgiN